MIKIKPCGCDSTATLKGIKVRTVEIVFLIRA